MFARKIDKTAFHGSTSFRKKKGKGASQPPGGEKNLL
jgi:hypothetical protein